VAEVAKALEIREHTLGRWRNQYCGMKADDAKELRRLRNENGRLKRPRSGAPATRCTPAHPLR
jgi:transposase-like protein